MAAGTVTGPLHADELRRLYPRVLAKTLRLTRSLPDAEDAVHDAIERALQDWTEGGALAPDYPEAWLVTVAANRHRDRPRRGRCDGRRPTRTPWRLSRTGARGRAWPSPTRRSRGGGRTNSWGCCSLAATRRSTTARAPRSRSGRSWASRPRRSRRPS
ncbi:MAG: hypothetical protein EPO40_08750 [Myxococcaceae bacterium]|nr:MAG: hypothetical protein EPO40_08750 [Myxococcaceae bacterium]